MPTNRPKLLVFRGFGVHFCSVKLEELPIVFRARTKADMLLRANQAMEFLLGAIQEGYYQVMVGSRGGSGSVGALQTQLQQTESAIIGIIGFGKSGDYLKYVEFGIKPAGEFPAMKSVGKGITTALAEWIRRARINVPDQFKSIAHLGRDRERALKALSRRSGFYGVHFSRIAAANIRAETARRARKPIDGGEDARARLRFAWAIAIKRKKFGYRGLHVISKIFKQEEAKIRAILEGASA